MEPQLKVEVDPNEDKWFLTLQSCLVDPTTTCLASVRNAGCSSSGNVRVLVSVFIARTTSNPSQSLHNSAVMKIWENAAPNPPPQIPKIFLLKSSVGVLHLHRLHQSDVLAN